MTNYIIFANTDDGHISSQSASYATAQAGTGTMAMDNTGNLLYAGQQFNGGLYNIYEAFLNFDTSVIATTEYNVSAQLRMTMIQNFGIAGTYAAFPYNNLDTRAKAWTSPLTTAQWKQPNQFDVLNPGWRDQFGAQYGDWLNSQATVWQSSPNRYNAQMVVNGGSTRMVMCTSRAAFGTAPTGTEYATFNSSNIGTTADPTLLVTTVLRSTMRTVSKCQAQLTTGDVAAIVSDGGTTPVLTLGYYAKGSTSFTSVATVPTGTGALQFDTAVGNQCMALVSDTSDNLYIIGLIGSSRKQFVGQGYVKGAGLTWTQKAVLSVPNVDDHTIQSLDACWLPCNGLASGLIWVEGFAEYVSWLNSSAIITADSPYVEFNCAVLLAGAGSPSNTQAILAQYGLGGAEAFDGQMRLVDVINFTNPLSNNPLLALCQMSKTVSGQLTISWRVFGFGPTGYGTSVSGSFTNPLNASTTVLGGESKIKTIQLDGSRIAIIYGQSSTYHSVIIVDSSGNGTNYSGLNLSTMPDMSQSGNWDAMYDPSAGNIWLFYLDATNNRRLARVPFSLAGLTWGTTETQVSAAVGAVGGLNDKLRIFSVTQNSLNVIIETSQRSSGGAYSTVAILDNLNVAPNAPAVNLINNFDATIAKAISWTFSDPNPGDTQGKYEIEIDNNSTSASAYRSGVVTSGVNNISLAANALANAITYRLRVRLYDSAGLQGPFSPYQLFTTAATGTVVITSPAADISTLITSSYFLTWTYTGTQAKYRVVMYRVSDSSVLLDTGTVTSTSNSYQITQIPSGVPVRIDVTLTNSSAVVAGPVSRYITTTYNAPDQITAINVTSQLTTATISWTIPTPTGSKPSPSTFDIYRSIDGGITYTAIVNLPAGSNSYVDAVVPSNSQPYYVIRSNSPTGYTWSVPKQAPSVISFFGITLSTLTTSTSAPWALGQALFYGGPTNVEAMDVGATSLQFAGRTYPVTEFGRSQTDSISVSMTIPFAGNPQTNINDTVVLTDAQIRTALTKIITARATVCFRDGRGRQVFGTLSKLNFADDPVGTKATFQIDAVDYVEGVTTTNVLT